MRQTVSTPHNVANWQEGTYDRLVSALSEIGEHHRARVMCKSYYRMPARRSTTPRRSTPGLVVIW